MKKIGLSLFIVLFLNSCATEKYNLSPLTNAFSTEMKPQENPRNKYRNFITENVNASEISGLIASFPTFKNDAVNKEISLLKIDLQEYLYAIKNGNKKAHEKSIINFEKHYKKIQKLRKFLNSDEDEVINRYLTRIKTNISEIEAVIIEE